MKQSIVDLHKNLADVLNRVAYGGERVILQRRGKGVAALVSIEKWRSWKNWRTKPTFARPGRP